MSEWLHRNCCAMKESTCSRENIWYFIVLCRIDCFHKLRKRERVINIASLKGSLLYFWILTLHRNSIKSLRVWRLLLKLRNYKKHVLYSTSCKQLNCSKSFSIELQNDRAALRTVFLMISYAPRVLVVHPSEIKNTGNDSKTWTACGGGCRPK